jgi:hypothetical protein
MVAGAFVQRAAAAAQQHLGGDNQESNMPFRLWMSSTE